jgi:hypothetical protein
MHELLRVCVLKMTWVFLQASYTSHVMPREISLNENSR